MTTGETSESFIPKSEVEVDKIVGGDELFNISNNPTLSKLEKGIAMGITRGVTIKHTGNSREVEINGLNRESQETLKNMAFEENGQRRNYLETASYYNSIVERDSSFAVTHVRMAMESSMNNFDNTVRRVQEGKGNCLEFGLVMQLLAKMYYSDDIEKVLPLGYTKPGGSRHFYVYIRERNQSEVVNYMMVYRGNVEQVDNEKATRRLGLATKKNRKDVQSIYEGYLKLLAL